MTLSKRPFIKPSFFVVCGLLFLGMVLAVAMLPYGQVRLTYDSHDILRASENLHTYLRGRNPDGHSYLVRAPFHPFLLSFFRDKLLAFWWINILSLAGSLFLVFKICRNAALSVASSVGVMIVTGAFVPWLLNFQFAWTEPLFIMLILLLCYALQNNGSPGWVLVICVSLFMVRKSGLFFFAGVAMVYVLDRKLLYAVVMALVGAVIFAAWEWLEFSFASTGFFPDWLPKLESYSRIYYLEAVTSWFLPLRIPLLFRSIVILVAVTAAFALFRSEIFFVSRQRQNLVLLVLGATYSLILISFRGVSEYEDAERYLSILVPLWFPWAASIAVRVLRNGSRRAGIFIFGSLALWLLYIFLRLVHYLFWSVV